jgi:hypothetical protein
VKDHSEPAIRLRAAFVASITEFIAFRKTHNGVVLPNQVLIEQAYREALYDTGIVPRPALEKAPGQ